MLTHTLHLPPALSEIYGGPRPDWLRDILDYLPCLQSLIVSKLPFFDHNAMTALKTFPIYGQSAGPYNVRLLLADREPNTTSAGLSEALMRFQELIYLDLSYTTSARDNGVLSCLSQLEHLQVLKLRGIGLKDNHAKFLANAIGTRVRFLDLRSNVLTDMAVRSLMQACFLPPSISIVENGSQGGSWTDVSPLTPNPSHHFFRRPDLDGEFIETLAHSLTGRSWVENLPHVGITHLYLAENQITVEAVASLLASGRLHSLDVGTVDTAMSLNRKTRNFSPDYEYFPGSEKLIPILGTIAKENLTYLRAHHAVLTAEAPSKDLNSPNMFLPELPGTILDNDLESNYPAAELSATGEVFEMPSEMNFVFELDDTSVSRPTESLAARPRDRRNEQADEPLPDVKRGSVYAPEVVEPAPIPKEDDGTPIDSAPMHVPDAFSDMALSAEGPHGQKIQELLHKRPKSLSPRRRDGKNWNPIPYLHPSHLPHLETLVLTDVPSHVPVNSPILSFLLRFITACSNEALLASLRAGSDYSLPPGQGRLRAEQARSRSLFALRRLVLEIVPVSESKGAPRLSPWKTTTYSNGAFQSSTGDRELENMWSAAMDDFSFFETECGIPQHDQERYFPMAAFNEKVSLMPEDDYLDYSRTPERDTLLPPSRSHTPRLRHNSMTPGPSATNISQSSRPIQPIKEPTVDLVAELASFRREKKAEYEELVRHDRRRRRTINSMSTEKTPTLPIPYPHVSPSPSSSSLRPRSRSPSPATVSAPHLAMAHYVEGHWKGEVKIVRNPAPKGRSGMVDMFGNYFEKGYLYP